MARVRVNKLILPANDPAEDALVGGDVSTLVNGFVHYTRRPNVVGGLRPQEGRGTQWRLPDSLAGPTPMPFSPSVDPLFHVWFAIRGAPTLVRLNKDTNQLASHGLVPVREVLGLGCDGDGKVWFFGEGGVGVLHPDSKQTVFWELPEGLKGPRAMWVDANTGSPWIAGLDERDEALQFIARLDPDTSRLTGWTLIPSSRRSHIRIAGDTEARNLWIAMPEFALRLETVNSRVHLFPNESGTLLDVDVAPDGTAWFGRTDGAVERIAAGAQCAKGWGKKWRLRVRPRSGKVVRKIFTAQSDAVNSVRLHYDAVTWPGQCSTLSKVPFSLGPGISAAGGSVFFGVAEPLGIGKLIEEEPPEP